VLEYLSNEGLMEAGLKVRTMNLPDIYIDQNAPAKMYEEAELTASDITKVALKALKYNDISSKKLSS
jgi:1-deoxy-D-xylulose-5-phosphate synthase